MKRMCAKTPSLYARLVITDLYCQIRGRMDMHIPWKGYRSQTAASKLPDAKAGYRVCLCCQPQFPAPNKGPSPPPQISARNDLKHRLPSKAALAGQGWFLGRRFEKKAAFGTKRDLLGVERNVAQLPFSWGPDRTALYSM